MVVARLLRRVGTVLGLALPTVVVPTSVINALVFDGAAHVAVHVGPHLGAHVGAVGASALSEMTPAAHKKITHADDDVITLAVTVQGRRIWDADDPLPNVAAGEPVDVVYEVRNKTLFAVSGVLVSDPVVGGGAVSCPGGGATISYVPALSSVDCYASVPAVPGRHNGTVTVTGTQTILPVQVPVAAHARVGYVGLGPSASPSPSPSASMTVLPRSRSASPPPPTPAPARPKPAVVPARAVPSPSPTPTPSRSTTPPSASPSPSASRSTALFRPLAAPLPPTPPKPGVPATLFVLIMAMPAAAGAAAALGRRVK